MKKKSYTTKTEDGYKLRYDPDSGFQIIEGKTEPKHYLRGGISKKINACARRRGFIRNMKEPIDPTKGVIRILDLEDRICEPKTHRMIAMKDRPIY